MPVFLDANIPMYAVGSAHPYKSACAAIIIAVAGGRLDAVSSSEVVQEILHRFSATGQRTQGLAVAQDFLDLLPLGILPVGRIEITGSLAVARAHPLLSARDCVHVATMVAHGLTDIISADKDFDGVPGIVRHDPLTIAAGFSL